MDSNGYFSDSDEDSLLDYNYIFVDIQGFKTYRNQFICKEFCLIDNDYIYHALVKSPYSFNKVPAYYKRQAYWLTNFYHGLMYEAGDTNIIEVKQNVYDRLQSKKVAVKGAEKIKWLQFMFRDCCEIECVNFDDLDYDHDVKMSVLNKVCNFHDVKLQSPECSLKNVLNMRNISSINRINIKKNKTPW